MYAVWAGAFRVGSRQHNCTVTQFEKQLVIYEAYGDFLYSLLAFLVSWCAYLFGLFLLFFLLLGKYRA